MYLLSVIRISLRCYRLHRGLTIPRSCSFTCITVNAIGIKRCVFIRCYPFAIGVRELRQSRGTTVIAVAIGIRKVVGIETMAQEDLLLHQDEAAF
jgi:hypothetical protein